MQQSRGIGCAESIREILRCPVCRSSLEFRESGDGCACLGCGVSFPVVDGIPILINESRSLFSLQDYLQGKAPHPPGSKLRMLLESLLPTISRNVMARTNYEKLAELLPRSGEVARVLVIGGRTLGEGMEVLTGRPGIQLIETDVSFGPRTALICDAHDLPFPDCSVDAVVAQAVLEYLQDPWRCVYEIRRVLKGGGLVYAEAPFMQQVHGGKYDFTRFTHLGLRRLFRHFEEIFSGPACGPGMALAWSYQYFLVTLAPGRNSRVLLRAFARFTSFWLKYLDLWLVGKPGAVDCASAFYFMGKKSDRVLSDRDLTELYRGIVRVSLP